MNHALSYNRINTENLPATKGHWTHQGYWIKIKQKQKQTTTVNHLYKQAPIQYMPSHKVLDLKGHVNKTRIQNKK